MELTREGLEETTIIFNHVPKVGGTSLIYLFHEIFGPERCFRHANRDHHTGEISPRITKIPRDELLSYRFLAGHFEFGNHRLFDRPVLYIGVVRDPLERLISDYYYSKKQGKLELREAANRLSLDEYVALKLEDPKSRMVTSTHCRFLAGADTADEAIAVLDRWYLACCTSEQLDDLQRLLARLYDRPDLAPRRLNITAAAKTETEISAPLLRRLEERFREDNRLIAWIAERFDRVYWPMDA
ncbi:MAG: hypothetical protein Kilf2KO_39740 [Rhodospirillales bacterium]